MATVDRGKSAGSESSAREHPDDDRMEEDDRLRVEELPGGDADDPAGEPNSPPGRPQPTYGDLMGSPQVQRWARRVGVAVVAGILFAVIFNVRVGLVVAVLVVIADLIRRARATPNVEPWRKRSAAERRTERQLRGMEKAGYRTLHARAVPRDEAGTSDGQIDHLVIGPTGVYAVDSEKWDKRLPVRALSHRKLFLGPFNKKERLDQARWECEQASKLLSAEMGYEVPVQPSLAIYGPAISWKVLMVRDVDVYSGGRARNYLRRRPKILTQADVETLFAAAKRVLPAKYPEPESEPPQD